MALVVFFTDYQYPNHCRNPLVVVASGAVEAKTVVAIIVINRTLNLSLWREPPLLVE